MINAPADFCGRIKFYLIVPACNNFTDMNYPACNNFTDTNYLACNNFIDTSRARRARKV